MAKKKSLVKEYIQKTSFASPRDGPKNKVVKKRVSMSSKGNNMQTFRKYLKSNKQPARPDTTIPTEKPAILQEVSSFRHSDRLYANSTRAHPIDLLTSKVKPLSKNHRMTSGVKTPFASSISNEDAYGLIGSKSKKWSTGLSKGGSSKGIWKKKKEGKLFITLKRWNTRKNEDINGQSRDSIY